MPRKYEVFWDQGERDEAADGPSARIVLGNGQRELNMRCYSMLPTQLFPKLANLEKLVFGSGAFGEYAICSARAERGDCGLVLPRDFLDTTDPLPDCPSCGAHMEEVFPSNLHVKYLQWIFNHGVKAVLLFDASSQIIGFSLMFVARIEDCLNEINYRRGYDFAEVTGALSRDLNILDPNQRFVCANRIGFTPEYQGLGLLPLLLRTNASQFSHAEDLPAIGDTMIHPSGRLFAPVVAAGYDPLKFADGRLMIDEHGGVLLGISRFGDFIDNLELDEEKFSEHCGSRLIAARSIQAATVGLCPAPGERRYWNAPILRVFEEDSDIQIFEANDLNDEILKHLARIFREIFVNGFGQYLFYPSDRVAISVEVIFGDKYVEVDTLDSLNLDEDSLKINGECPVFWHHSKITEDILRKKLSNDGKLSILFDENRIAGFAFGYRASFSVAFESLEEWANPQLYSGFTPDFKRISVGEVFPIINQALTTLGLKEMSSVDEIVFVFSAIAFLPEFRSRGNLKRLLRKLFSQFSEDNDNDLVFLETKLNSKAYSIFESAGAHVVDGVLNEGTLKDGDIVFMVARFKNFREHFSSLPTNSNV